MPLDLQLSCVPHVSINSNQFSRALLRNDISVPLHTACTEFQNSLPPIHPRHAQARGDLMMGRPSRQSVASGGEDVNREDVDVTAILNAEAAGRRDTPSLKRKRTSDAPKSTSASWSKRTDFELPSTSTPTTTPTVTLPNSVLRSSGRLKARTSLLGQTHPSNDSPSGNAATSKTVSRPAATIEPPNRLRALKMKQLKVSPFRGKGVLETRTTAHVNLDDSPRKPPTKSALQKISKSLHTRRGRPTDAADIFEQALGPQTPDLGPILAPTPPGARDTPVKAVRRLAPRKTTRERAQLSQIARPLRQEIEEANDGEVLGVPSPLAQDKPPGKRRQPKNTESGRQTPASQKREEPGKDHKTKKKNSTQDDDPYEEDNPYVPRSTEERPETEAEKRERELKHAEAEAKRQQRIQDALRGIEQAARLHGCKLAWQEMLVAIVDIGEIRASNEPTSVSGKAAARALKDLNKKYKRLAREDLAPPEDWSDSLLQSRRLFKERCRYICGYRHRPDMKYDLERKKMIQDIYEHLIPDSLALAKLALKARFRDGELSEIAQREIVGLLQMTKTLVTSAARWRPRPEFHNLTKSTVNKDIGPNIDHIIRQYHQAMAAAEARRFVDELELKQRADLERLQAAADQRREEIRARHRGYAAGDRSREKAPVVDIDDLQVDFHYTVNLEDRFSVNKRPPIRREPTEDIPAPAPIEWEESENMVLLNALQQFQGMSRFQDILDIYGGARGRLRAYDMDQIMAQATWLKQSMARPLKEEFDESWDWLRSVPD